MTTAARELQVLFGLWRSRLATRPTRRPAAVSTTDLAKMKSHVSLDRAERLLNLLQG